MAIAKPANIFDRDVEWDELVHFAGNQRPGATLGVVSGRRRQGKTLLLYELAQATDGFYFGATEATEAESLRRLGEVLGRHNDAPGPIHLRDWARGFDVLLALGREPHQRPSAASSRKLAPRRSRTR